MQYNFLAAEKSIGLRGEFSWDAKSVRRVYVSWGIRDKQFDWRLTNVQDWLRRLDGRLSIVT